MTSTAPTPPGRTAPERTALIRRHTGRLCLALGWVPLHEVALGNGRRADILALRGDFSFVCIEIKSDARDFLADRKWHHYRDYADALYFAVDADFPQELLPVDAGLIVAAEGAAMLREAPEHRLSAPRRTALLRRFARLAALRLARFEDPAGVAELQAALSAE